ncbi:MAG: PilT/PilU family type 4a pilus ATPase [Candidatus Nanopelagicales bacterium]|nr:PilT/PilU family type 4a pilus ATPase [Candidatus Nanopelagicales bacterium]
MSATPEQLDGMLQRLWGVQGTDLHLTAGSAPLIRVRGELQRVPDTPTLKPADTAALAQRLLTTQQQQELDRGRDVDFSVNWQGKARIRGNVFHQRGSVAIALRVMPRRIPTFAELGLPESVSRLASLTRGLVIVGGPTGSGKSTTMAALIDWINENRAVHVLTIEDPIEFLHAHKRGAVNQREIGSDAESFASALRSAVREDPDVLLVGEMRDIESIRVALTLAETGHLVFATLHTNDTAQTVNRLVDVFPTDQQPQIRLQLSSAVTAIVHQRLLPRIGGGQVAAFEVLLANAPVRNLIAQGKYSHLRNQMLTFQRQGMQTLEASLSDLVAKGTIEYGSALAHAQYPADVGRT